MDAEFSASSTHEPELFHQWPRRGPTGQELSLLLVTFYFKRAVHNNLSSVTTAAVL